MTFSEIGNSQDEQASNSLPQLETELSGINAERKSLNQQVIEQWPDIPASAVSYLATNCPNPESMSGAIAEVRTLLVSDSAALDDPDIAALLLDDCLARAEKSEKRNKLGDIKNTENSLLTTKSVLTHISKQTQSLNGYEKLSAARQRLSDPSIPESIRLELSVRFDGMADILDDMSAVFADKPSKAAFQDIINRTALDFNAAIPSQAFTEVMVKIEMSDQFTNNQKIKLRQIVTGSHAQEILSTIITDESGNRVPRFTEKHQRELRSGITGYAQNNGRQIIECRAGSHLVTKDVSGWSGENVGLLIETMHMWNVLDSFGVTGFVENVYKIDFSILGSGNAFDPMQITKMRQVISHLIASHEGYDGDIANLEKHKTLLKNQARLLSETQTAYGWENDASGTARTLLKLGMVDENDQPNMETIKAFGNYTRENYVTGKLAQNKLVEYLKTRISHA